MYRKMTSLHRMTKDSLDMAIRETLRYINAIHLRVILWTKCFFHNSINYNTRKKPHSFFSKVMEMALAGWRFFVLSPAFAIHWGLQKPGYQKHDRLLEVANNFFRFRPFLGEKISQYKDEYGNFRLMYMNQEIKKIYKMVLENTWPQYMIRKNGGYVH